MTTFTIYASANDHYITSTDATYSNARSGAGSKTDDSSGTSLFVGQLYPGGSYSVYQAFLSFDTSSVPAISPDSIELALYLGAASLTSTKQFNASERSWSGGAGDFVAGASLSGLSGFGSRNFTNGEAAGYKAFPGPSDVARTSAYKLIVYANDQQTNTVPTSADRLIFSSADTSGTTQDPKLTITITYKLTAAAGAYTLTGMPALLTYGKRLVAAAGSFLLTGIAAAMGIKRYPPAGRTINFPASTLETRTLEL